MPIPAVPIALCNLIHLVVVARNQYGLWFGSRFDGSSSSSNYDAQGSDVAQRLLRNL